MELLMIQQRSVESMQQAHNYKKKIVVVTVTHQAGKFDRTNKIG